MEKYSVGISGIGSYVPDKVLTNDDLSKMVDTSHEWIVERTGIEQRRIVDEGTASSDLGIKAALKALEDANTSPEELDLIIVATATPDYLFPSTACIIQDAIGAKNAAAFDLEAGCSGFVYGIATGSNFVMSGAYKKVLIVGAETLSKITNWEDRNTCVLFGDGAGACVLERCEKGYGILSFELGADGSGGDTLIVPAGGSKNPASLETVNNGDNYLRMEGREVFKFAVRKMPEATLKALEKANLGLEDLDFLVPHQANMRIIDAAAKKLKLSKEKICVNLNKYGNISSASVPVSLDEVVKDGRVKKGDNLVLVAFGAGLTWGSVAMKWSKEG